MVQTGIPLPVQLFSGINISLISRLSSYCHAAFFTFSAFAMITNTYSSYTKRQRHHIHNRLCSYLGLEGAQCVRHSVWTFSVYIATDIKKGSVINVVCYERVCYERVCYEHDLF